MIDELEYLEKNVDCFHCNCMKDSTLTLCFTVFHNIGYLIISLRFNENISFQKTVTRIFYWDLILTECLYTRRLSS